MFFNERLVGYLDMNDVESSTPTNASHTDATLFLNKVNFNAHSKNYNCVLQQNACGLVEIVCHKDVMASEPLVCWFAEPYLKNIKSKKKKKAFDLILTLKTVSFYLLEVPFIVLTGIIAMKDFLKFNFYWCFFIYLA